MIPTLKLADYGRSGHVTRWHSVRTARDQTLAEHHYMVAILSLEMARRILGEALSCDMTMALLEYALKHDAAELLMGDMPTPVKRRMEAILDGQRNPLDVIEAESAPEVIAAKKAIAGTPLERIVKLADIIDALHFISIEGRTGHSRAVTGKLHRMFTTKVEQAEKEYPDYNWAAAVQIRVEMMDGEATLLEFEDGA